MVLPITSAGLALFEGDASVAPDSIVLALPLAQGRDWLALAAYVGGFSAATGMVIVASVALATMVSNDLVMPPLLRRGRSEEHTSELQSLMRISYAVFCLKNKTKKQHNLYMYTPLLLT